MCAARSEGVKQSTEIVWSNCGLDISFPSRLAQERFITGYAHTSFFNNAEWAYRVSPRLGERTMSYRLLDTKNTEASGKIFEKASILQKAFNATLIHEVSRETKEEEKTTESILPRFSSSPRIIRSIQQEEPIASVLRITDRTISIKGGAIHLLGLEKFMIVNNTLYLSSFAGYGFFEFKFTFSPSLAPPPKGILRQLLQTSAKWESCITDITLLHHALRLEFATHEDLEGFKQLAFFFFPGEVMPEDTLSSQPMLTYSLPSMDRSELEKIAEKIKLHFPLVHPNSQEKALQDSYFISMCHASPSFKIFVSIGEDQSAEVSHYQAPRTKGAVQVFRELSPSKKRLEDCCEKLKDLKVDDPNVRNMVSLIRFSFNAILRELEGIEEALGKSQETLPPPSMTQLMEIFEILLTKKRFEVAGKSRFASASALER